MIDTNKLIPQRKQSERLSGKTIVTIGLIKKDVVKIDSLLKEKLVLSKVRYGILRQKNERDRRSRREDVLESKKDRSQDYDVKSNKKRKGFGGFLGGILKAVLAGLGFTMFKSLPALLKIGRMIKIIATPLILGATVFISAVVRLARAATQVLPDVKGKDFQGASKKSIESGIDGLGRALIETAIAFAVGSAAGIGVSRLVRGKTYTKAGAVAEIRENLMRGKNVQKKNVTQMRSSQSYADAIRGGTEVGLYADDVRIPKKTRTKTKEQINLDIDRKFSRSDIPMYDSRYTPEENFLRMSLGIDDFPETSRKIKKTSTPKQAFEWNGSSWTAGNAYGTAKVLNLFGGGPQTAAWMCGGSEDPGLRTFTNHYDGTTWATAPSLGTARSGYCQGGTQAAGLIAGGTSTEPSTRTTATEEFTGETTTANVKTFSTS